MRNNLDNGSRSSSLSVIIITDRLSYTVVDCRRPSCSGRRCPCLKRTEKVTHRFFRHALPHLWNQLPTSLRIPHPNYSSPSQRPSFEHTGLTCYTLLSSSITFSLFHSKLKTYLFRKSYPPAQSVPVCRTDLTAVDRSPDLFAHLFYVLVLFFVLVIHKCGRLSWPAFWSTFMRTINSLSDCLIV